MATLDKKIQHALNETRILMIGTQVWLGFTFLVPFAEGFSSSSSTSQFLVVGSLYLLSVTVGFLLMPVTYHVLVEKGAESRLFHKKLTTSQECALLPFALALGINIYIPAERVMGHFTGALLGVIGTSLALFLWYGLEFFINSREGKKSNNAVKRMKENGTNEAEGKSKMPDLDKRIDQVLTEVRIVLPGLQALLGFQFSTIFQKSFDQLPLFSKNIHFASLSLIAISIMLLMTPAAYHRIVDEGEDSERLHRLSSILIILAMLLLALGLVGDIFVVVYKLTESAKFSIGAACAMLLVFYGMWFGYTTYLRFRLPPNQSGHN